VGLTRSALFPDMARHQGQTQADSALSCLGNHTTPVYHGCSFPGLTIPISSVMGGIIDFMLSFHMLRVDGVDKAYADKRPNLVLPDLTWNISR
jgi:hypothetical protein